jgi:hypothetical protein
VAGTGWVCLMVLNGTCYSTGWHWMVLCGTGRRGMVLEWHLMLMHGTCWLMRPYLLLWAMGVMHGGHHRMRGRGCR